MAIGGDIYNVVNPTCESHLEDAIDGDLGYGLRLKPGGIPNFCKCNNLSNRNDLPHFAYLCQSKDRKPKDCVLSNRQSISSNSIESIEINELIEEQRNLFILELKKIFRMNKKDDNIGIVHIEDESSNNTITQLQDELKKAEQKIENLQIDLEVYRKLLFGKYKASKILIKQLNNIKNEKTSKEEIIKKECTQLQKEVNSLQFSLDYTISQLTNSQRDWLERYNSIAHENSELLTTVKEQAEVIKTLLAKRMALSHERDELIVLLDAKERLAYRRSSSLSSDDSSSEVTSLELSTLGACSCRGKNQEPCRCARAACSKQRHIMSLNKQLQNLEAQLNETHCIAQAFQIAFEEQLKKNRNILKLSYANKLKNTKLSLSSLIKKSESTNYEAIIENLINLLCDKNEALLHQRLLTNLLAKKLQDLHDIEEK